MPSSDHSPSYCYQLHGLTVRVPFELPGATLAVSTLVVDYVLCASAEPLPRPGPGATLAATLSVPGGGYHLFTEGGTADMVFPGQATFLATGQNVRYFVHPGGDAALIPAFFSNAVLAALLGLSGVPVLHSSAVVLGGAALAIAGQSGAGKSALAAALCLHGEQCREGAALLTDDTLRVVVSTAGLVAHAGVKELRLRSGAEAILADSPWPKRRTVDERLGALPAAADSAPLRSLWVPQLIAPGGALTLRALSGHACLIALLKNLRIAGFSERVVAGLLPSLNTLASALQIYEARIPSDWVHSANGRERLYRAAIGSVLGS